MPTQFSQFRADVLPYSSKNEIFIRMSTIAAQLRKLKTKYYELIRVRKHLIDLDIKVAKDYNQLDKLQKKMDNEFSEYDKLEGKSLKGFFYSVLGSKEKQLEKERQEYVAASLKYEEFRKAVELEEYEINVLTKKIEKLEIIESKYQDLIVKRENELMRGNTQAGLRLVKTIKKIEKNEQIIHEMKKTDAIGLKAINSLSKMIHYLQSAKNWGNWDMMSGGRRGGRNSNWAKHSAIDKAKNVSHSASHLLRQFENGLVQIYGQQGRYDFRVQIDAFGGFTNIFFDNLISDWIIQQKISNSLNNVSAVKDKATRIVQSLRADIESVKSGNIQLKKERKRIIEES